MQPKQAVYVDPVESNLKNVLEVASNSLKNGESSRAADRYKEAVDTVDSHNKVRNAFLDGARSA